MPPRSSRTALGLGVLCGALALALAWSLFLREGSAIGARKASPPVVLPAIADELWGNTVWDTHPDPDVGRVLQPNLTDRLHFATAYSTNSWGLREREWGPKAEGVVRVVTVGDSYVIGLGVAAEDRFGVALEQMLQARAGAPVEVEVLHVAVSSWNLEAQCAFTRRSLGTLSPDLVIHCPNRNDLADMLTARGTGEQAEHSARLSARVTGTVKSLVPGIESNHTVPTHLARGLCWEARERYAQAARDIARLEEAVRASNSAYLMLTSWSGSQPMVTRYFAPVLGEKQLAQLPDRFLADKGTWVSEYEHHWSKETHSKVAKLLFGLIQQRSLLPALALDPWEEAARYAQQLQAQADRESRNTGLMEERIAALELVNEIDFAKLDDKSVQQIYAGVHQLPRSVALQSFAAPYVSLIFPARGARELAVRAKRVARPELQGRTRVYVEEFEVGEWDLVGPVDIEERFALPEHVVGREFLNVRFVSDDYLYGWPRACVSFELKSVSIL